MKIFDKEYGFLLTVDALCTIAEACPAHDINRIDEWIGDTLPSIAQAMKVMAPAMSKGYCDVMRETDPKFKGEPLTDKIIGMMLPAQIIELEKAIAEAYKIGQETTIDTESKKK